MKRVKIGININFTAKEGIHNPEFGDQLRRFIEKHAKDVKNISIAIWNSDEKAAKMDNNDSK